LTGEFPASRNLADHVAGGNRAAMSGCNGAEGESDDPEGSLCAALRQSGYVGYFDEGTKDHTTHAITIRVGNVDYSGIIRSDRTWIIEDTLGRKIPVSQSD
jgi:hypothetical protein